MISLTCVVKPSTKHYSYYELKDLQSKLTLVAGDKQRENQETIKRFNAVSNIC